MKKLPEDSYFIHGFSNWSKNHVINFLHPQISVSLQKDGFTFPLRPIGFILQIKENGIIAAFDRDVASKLINGKKVFSNYSCNTNSYTDLDLLLKNTPKGSHNELWVYSDFVEIIGGYTIGGFKSFEKAMKKADYPIHYLQF